MPMGYFPKLEAFMRWQKRPQADRMLDMGESPEKVCRWVNANGFKISTPTLYDYCSKRSEAIMRGITLEKLLQEQCMSRIKVFPEDLKNDGLYNSRKKVKNDIELLDVVINKGMAWLRQNPDSYLTVNYAIRAIELKERITGGKLGGMTFAGLEEYKRITEGRLQAMLGVAMSYVPEDIRDQVIQEMYEAEKKYMEDNGLIDQFEADDEIFELISEGAAEEVTEEEVSEDNG